ncbi:hypothetical protein EAH81_19825 [Flavobacterium pectinovorum]|uniref:Uncharacterized protein n=1 Tax=Flavobacterium pectinovorum TaxID=29533 RepID=A0A502EGK5_9FLAO|nr:hypothetical protein EAH81_19825 [Flavobacterium pectinovorum]
MFYKITTKFKRKSYFEGYSAKIYSRFLFQINNCMDYREASGQPYKINKIQFKNLFRILIM